MYPQLKIDMQYLLTYPNTRLTFFWSRKSVFSNFYHAPFAERVVDGFQYYTCTEQYMMHKKALFFGDEEVAQQIISLPYGNPHDYKKLGRNVRGFDGKAWDAVKVEFVLNGCLLKFSQNEELKQALMNTKGTVLAEASPYDGIWGIKLGAEDPRAHDPRQWRGQNLLGFILTEVRRRLSE